MDNIGSLTGLALDVLLPLAILYLASDRAQGRVRPESSPGEPAAEPLARSH